ncbi:hypothetical protein ACQKDD_13830 [Planococcus kocurii]|uniref:hypothetical protein n=1 Tax=Planococcus kocurii TaxID=1374 RepID=UPI003CFBD75A
MVFAVVGIRSVLGFESDRESGQQLDQADQLPVVTVDAEEAKETETVDKAVTREEQAYVEGSSFLLEGWIGYLDRIRKMHIGLLDSYDNPAETTVDIEVMVAEMSAYSETLKPWANRNEAPEKFQAYDAALTEMVERMLAYVEKLDSALHEDMDDVFVADGHYFNVKFALDDVTAVYSS